nr:ATP-binding protein [Candidatus Freyarchaeota archaeon]
MKKEIDRINAVPSKRLFLSIIADYDLNTAICELIDNVIDIRFRNSKNRPTNIAIELDKNQQTIRVLDDAGGVKESELDVIIGPGHTTNLPTDETIGIFGVGTKRAVVALAQDIKITTRYGNDKTCRVEFDDSWLQNDDWELPVYEVDDIPQGTSVIELQKLRVIINDEAISMLKEHLQRTYERFLGNGIVIKLNSETLTPIKFENWAYPPGNSPMELNGTLPTEDGKTVKVKILAGLARESSPAGGEYGVYFYCNDRLIARALKDYEVGFTKGLAGQPHPSVSLIRVIVSLNGEAQSMPWNSSKSGINYKHPIFVALRDHIVQVVKHWASLSRGWEGNWPKNVFKYKSGNVVQYELNNVKEAKKSYLPQLPKFKHRYIDLIKQANRKVAKEKPWTKGQYETIIAVDIISKQHLEQKNRICLVLLDSTLEIAFKEYLLNESGERYSDERILRLFRDRNSVQEEIKKHFTLAPEIWKKINYYYSLRCKLIHERANVVVSDSEIEDFREIVQNTLKEMFGLVFDIE